MNVLKNFIKWFLYITTGILIVCAVVFMLYDMEALPKNTLWHILLSGFLTALVTTVFASKESAGKAEAIIRYLLHYASMCVIMIVCGHWFGWLNLDFGGIMMMVVSVLVVYVLVLGSHYIIDVKQADEINRKLKEKYKNEA
ncbi:MAG: DUF3021 family protein [Lachnospiraceae bacterium]|nr:DUF3021 family protein [Lachnospiraceae bacterium]